MRWFVLATLLLASLTAGCTSGDGDTTVLHIQGTQCEAYPWGDRAGGDVERPGLADRIADHYGIPIASARVTSDGGVNPAVCGAASDQHVEVRTSRPGPLLADGWGEGSTPKVD